MASASRKVQFEPKIKEERKAHPCGRRALKSLVFEILCYGKRRRPQCNSKKDEISKSGLSWECACNPPESEKTLAILAFSAKPIQRASFMSFSNQNAAAPKSPTTPIAKIVLLAAALSLISVAYALFGDFLSLETLAKKEQTLRDWRERHVAKAIVLSFLVYVSVAGLSLPGAALLTIFLGWFHGFGLGLLVASLASSAGATLAFLISRFFLRDFVQNKFGNRLKTFNETLQQEGVFYLFALRLVVVVPFFITNLAMGVTPIRTWTFWWVSQLGMLPGTAVYVYAGASFPSLSDLAEKGVQGILTPQMLLAFLLLGLFPVFVKKLLKRFRQSI